MDIKEFQNKYLNVILAFEKETGKNAVWHNEITNPFVDHLQQRNIKINYKLPKLLIPKRYHYLPHISEFWLKFLQNHSYFAKRRVTEDYISKYNHPKDKCDSIKKEFVGILRYLQKHVIIEHRSISTYSINKEKVSQYS